MKVWIELVVRLGWVGLLSFFLATGRGGEVIIGMCIAG